MRPRTPLNWLWLAGPPVGALAVGGALQALRPGHAQLSVFAILFAYLAFGAGRSPRSLSSPPARPGWTAHPPFRNACARVGTLLAAGSGLAVMAVGFSTAPPTLALAVSIMVLTVAVSWRPLLRVVRDAPTLRLTAAGVEIGAKRYTWEEVQDVELNGSIDFPELHIGVAGRRRPVILRPGDLAANLVFLLDLIGYYAANPARRPAVGTDAEAQRVYDLLLDARLAAGQQAGPTPITVGGRLP